MGIDSVRMIAPADGRTLDPQSFVSFVRRIFTTNLLEGDWDRLDDRLPDDPPCTTHWVLPPYAVYTGAYVANAYGWDLDPRDAITAQQRAALDLRYTGDDVEALLRELAAIVEHDDVGVWAAALDGRDDEMRHVVWGREYPVLIVRTSTAPHRLFEWSAYASSDEQSDRACQARNWITVSGRSAPHELDLVDTPFGEAIRATFGNLWTGSVDM
jgi:hypothetical protein